MIFTAPCPLFYLPYKSFSLDTSDKSTVQITSSCFTVCWRKVGVLYFIHHRQQYNLKKDTYVYIIVFSDFWWDNFFSKSIKLLSLMYQSNSCIEHMFFSIRLLSTRFLSLLACLSLEFYVAFHFGFHPVWISSNFLYFFGCSECWLP